MVLKKLFETMSIANEWNWQPSAEPRSRPCPVPRSQTIILQVVYSADHVDIIFMLFTLQSCVRTSSYQKWNMDFFVLFNQQTQSLFTNTTCFSFYVPSHMHLQTRCAPSNDFSVLLVLIQWLFWFIHIGFFFTLLQSLLASCRSFLLCSTHTYTLF